MKHTTNFLKWIFKNYSESDIGNFGRMNSQLEYGISTDDMLSQYTDEALEDAKEFLNNTSAEDALIKNYVINMRGLIDCYNNEIKHYTS